LGNRSDRDREARAAFEDDRRAPVDPVGNTPPDSNGGEALLGNGARGRPRVRQPVEPQFARQELEVAARERRSDLVPNDCISRAHELMVLAAVGPSIGTAPDRGCGKAASGLSPRPDAASRLIGDGVAIEIKIRRVER
jgi:hypothetical protein